MYMCGCIFFFFCDGMCIYILYTWVYVCLGAAFTMHCYGGMMGSTQRVHLPTNARNRVVACCLGFHHGNANVYIVYMYVYIYVHLGRECSLLALVCTTSWIPCTNIYLK